LWHFLPRGYLFTIAVETPVLLLLLSRGHSVARRLAAGVWLTACTYPVVVLVLPVLIPDPRWLYLLVAETFAPLAECALFGLAFHAGRGVPRRARYWDYAVVTLANLLSFGLGEVDAVRRLIG
ncbi:MAG TPA: hypothetical protein VF796_13240, partial [Humisphaera sp.]